jgi:hypothetical protein
VRMKRQLTAVHIEQPCGLPPDPREGAPGNGHAQTHPEEFGK